MKTIVITSGGTEEPIDSVRKITNMSTGRLGADIANRLCIAGHKVIYVHSKTAIKPEPYDDKNLSFVKASSTQEVYEALQEILTSQKVDYVIHSMAISDYTVDYVTTVDLIGKAVFGKPVTSRDAIKMFSDMPKEYRVNKNTKISSTEDGLMIKLKRTPKIISEIKKWNPDTKLIGFKLLNGVSEEELIRVASDLLAKNNCSYVIANDLANIRDGVHKAFLVGPTGAKEIWLSKEEISAGLTKLISEAE
jgi:phosphopantothenate-cysteine ligase